jgi:2,3-bisphosphoglycerate-independent phosphoglycerate mutase
MSQHRDDVSPVVSAVLDAYQQGQEDESLEPIVAADSAKNPLGRMADQEYVIFYDIRGEREIQITQSLTERGFTEFPVASGTQLKFVTMIEYSSDLPVKVAFPPESEVKNTLVEVLSRSDWKVTKFAESEKAIHVAYFLNGKNENPFPHEERIVVPSPEGFSTFAEKPEMSAAQVADGVIERLQRPGKEVIIANLANVDVVGHTEDKKAIIQAVETVDKQLGRLVSCCRQNGITILITADHGTVEEWLYPDGQINTGHTSNPVPFILADFSQKNDIPVDAEGELTGVAPTVLELLGLNKPEEMNGRSLLSGPAGSFDKREKLLLLILDGWGLKDASKGNLIAEADTPHFDEIWDQFPHSHLKASGEAVGMPPGTVGNSESGHLHLGAGRRVFLDRVRIDRAIADGKFFQNDAFIWAMEGAKRDNKPLHLLGIVSHYSSHGTIDHLFALLQMARDRGVKDVYIHSLIGRRGEKPESGAAYVEKVEQKCSDLKTGQVVTVMGRFWALDREENWDRVEKAYRALVEGRGLRVIV